ncbi:hypothetical protein PCANC_02537 [Puccinia coronata f. sp. avenae]|uniref:Uncharacterized protein n=1 Tax=Puccinia coronata f. sp. avenae TaxID=200324 RepID=A0A2N5T7D2_9BASI|nr:hypothetical protein PCASD_18160 [Puccinia coronata f. sp. avenae]PLW21378.1 hypothetical protein PCANC_03836 [Puccinia coronata f. sp. avenae]PLW50745.1 hypothetical protein PCASD_00688 [Puccinia coronata f. sp. avenae]PLW55015.1 hypothetical protein PCANC_02537 [Puccinia coronata f. sp. avenae]
MPSFAYLLAVFSLLASVAFAEDVSNVKPENVDGKWIYGNSVYGGFNVPYYGSAYRVPSIYNWVGGYGPFSACGIIAGGYPRYWFKNVDAATSTARRSLSLVSEKLAPRADSGTVQCKDSANHVDTLNVADCMKAVEFLVTKKVASSSCRQCTVKMLTPDGPVVPAHAPIPELQKLASQTLQACTQAPPTHTRRTPADAPAGGAKQVAMVFEEGTGDAC